MVPGRSTGTLSYKPRAGEDLTTATVVAPMVETVMSIAGTSTTSHTNYTGISVGYGWTSTVNAMSNNHINYNNVHHVTRIMADGAAIYTLSNQGPASQLQYNYIHDYQTSQWADYGDNGLYLDEQTSGYTVAHNAMVNAPTNVAQNHTGTNTLSDTPSSDPSSISSMAGLESAYADIKNTKVSVPSF